MLKNGVRFVLLLSLMTFTNKSHAQSITVASDIWCPFICDSVNQKGVIIDVINAIAKNNNLDIKFELIPLSRSLRMAQNKQVDIVLALTNNHISEFQLQKSQLSFGGLYNDFYVNDKSDWHFNNLESLSDALNQGKSIGIINGYEYGSQISKLIKNHQKVTYLTSGNTPLESSLKMLNNQRIDIVLDSRFNVDFEISNHKLTHIKHAGTQGIFTPLYLGYRQGINQELINDIDLSLKKMRKNGQLASILKRYKISDWQKKDE